jgi:hypothetical protein
LGELTPGRAAYSVLESASEALGLNKTEIFQRCSPPFQTRGKSSQDLARLLLSDGRGNESPKNINRSAEVDGKTTGRNIRTKD